jgi:hypothetical protein
VSALHGDAVIACADLVGRAGASGFEIGWTCPHVPDEPDDHNCPDVTWHATAAYRGARIMTAEHRSPTLAAVALSERLLSGAACRCGEPVTLADDEPGCRWTLAGKRWEPGCDVPPVHVKGRRGDRVALARAMAERERTRGAR